MRRAQCGALSATGLSCIAFSIFYLWCSEYLQNSDNDQKNAKNKANKDTQ